MTQEQQEQEKKFDPYTTRVQEVSLPSNEEPEPEVAKTLNRKLAVFGVLTLLGVIFLVVIAQGFGAEDSRVQREEQARLEAQEEQVQLDPERAEKDAEWLLEQQKKKQAAEAARKQKEEEEARKQKEAQQLATVTPSQDEETLALARGIAAARRGGEEEGVGGGAARGGKVEEDPWVAARRAFRAQDAQSYYQNRMAARKAGQFFAGGSPSSSGGGGGGGRAQGTPMPPEQDSPEAFAERLRVAQQNSWGTSNSIQPSRPMPQGSAGGGGMAGSYASLESGNAHQEAFLYQGQRAQAGFNGESQRGRGGRVDVQAGTLVHLVMETGLSSELPGVVIARVARPVYDPTLSQVTIPSGTKVIGTYNARVEQGQTRAQVVWTTLVWSGGGSFDLGGLPGVDLGGASGVEADVDEHWDKAFAGAALSGVLSASASALAGPTNQLNVDPRQQAIYGAAQPFQETGEARAKAYLELEPTLSLEPGALVGLLVPHDLSLSK